jgi:hypothetical protein
MVNSEILSRVVTLDARVWRTVLMARAPRRAKAKTHLYKPPRPCLPFYFPLLTHHTYTLFYLRSPPLLAFFSAAHAYPVIPAPLTFIHSPLAVLFSCTDIPFNTLEGVK